MFPNLHSSYETHISHRKAALCCNFFDRKSAGALPSHFDYIGISEFGFPVPLSARRLKPEYIEGVAIIFTVAAILKVFPAIVALAAILMVYRLTFGPWPYKGRGYNDVDRNGFMSRAGLARSKRNKKVFPPESWFKCVSDISRSPNRILAGDADIAKIRNFIPAFIANNWAPIFSGHGG